MLTVPPIKYGSTSQRWKLFLNTSTLPSQVCTSCLCCCCPWLRWSHGWCMLDKLGGVSMLLQTWRVLDWQMAEIFFSSTRPWLKTSNEPTHSAVTTTFVLTLKVEEDCHTKNLSKNLLHFMKVSHTETDLIVWFMKSRSQIIWGPILRGTRTLQRCRKLPQRTYFTILIR